MTFTMLVTAPRGRPLLFTAEPLFAGAGLLIAMSLPVTLLAAGLDSRTFQGDDIWLKPIKFQIALSLYLLTLAFFARSLPAGMREKRAYRLYAGVVVASVLAELAWIGGAAMAGTASHFNESTLAMAALYRVMGVLAVVLTSASLVYGIAIWRNRGTRLPSPLHLAVALGLVLTFVLTLPVAGILSQSGGHFIGTPVTGAAVPVFGWSREVGDLRVAHFLATHSMHFIPAAGLAATALLPERAAVLAVWAASALHVAAVVGSLGAALAGLPAIPLA